MKMFRQHLIILGVFYLHQTDTFVVTKTDSSTLAAYLNHVRKTEISVANETVEAFIRENVKEYCHELRLSDMYESVQTSMDQHPEEIIPPYNYVISRKLLDLEEQHGQTIRIRKFRIQDSKQTLTAHSFECFNSKKELQWFITPAFIPDSAFLFEIEPRYREVVLREINGNNEIPARLVGIIDRNGSYEGGGFDWKKPNPIPRDPLCDVNPIIQFRLCVLLRDANRRNPLPIRINDDRAYQDYNNRSSNFYYQPADYGESCKIPTIDGEISVHRELLCCSLRTMGMGKHFYLGLDPLKKFHAQYFSNEIRDFSLYYKIPLLQHLDKYSKVLDKSFMQ